MRREVTARSRRASTPQHRRSWRALRRGRPHKRQHSATSNRTRGHTSDSSPQGTGSRQPATQHSGALLLLATICSARCCLTARLPDPDPACSQQHRASVQQRQHRRCPAALLGVGATVLQLATFFQLARSPIARLHCPPAPPASIARLHRSPASPACIARLHHLPALPRAAHRSAARARSPGSPAAPSAARASSWRAAAWGSAPP